MPDMDRADLTRMIYRKLLDPRFRHRLSARDTEGSHPILVAMRTDRMMAMLHQVESVGGAANVIVPSLNGFLVLAVEADETPDDAPGAVPTLDAASTVGAFLELLRLEVPSGDNYSCRFVVDGTQPESGFAELVAIGD